MKCEANSCFRIGPSCVTTSVRAYTGALMSLKASWGAAAASGPSAVVILDGHKTSFLHRLVILCRNGKIFSPCDGLLAAFRLLRRHQRLSLAVGDPSLPSLHHIVGGRVWNLPWKGEAYNPLAEILCQLCQLAGEVCVQ